jgi:hypothetical protein
MAVWISRSTNQKDYCFEYVVKYSLYRKMFESYATAPGYISNVYQVLEIFMP